jgi:hypothetical protein
VSRMTRQRKCCPVCKFHKTYAGPICPSCTKIGYEMQPDGRAKLIKKKKEATNAN